MMVRIAIDAMGGDHAPAEIVAGAVAALAVLDNVNLTFVGKSDEIEAVLQGRDYPSRRVEIRHAAEVIDAAEDPGLAVRRKKESSMVKALDMVRQGEAHAALSAGNTGALMAAGLLLLGRLRGISRPALLTPMPSFSGKAVLFLDVGANMDATASQLLQYAYMGRIYAQQILSRQHPRIALMNVGVESNKGNSQARKAHALLREHLPGFEGNIEGTEAFHSSVDVVVCDGFVGNIFLKSAEGLSRTILGFFRQEIKTSLRFKMGAMLLSPVFFQLREKIDDSGYGGAPLLGVRGLSIKCHGSARARSIEQALIKQAYPFVQKNVTGQLQEALDELAGRFGERRGHGTGH